MLELNLGLVLYKYSAEPHPSSKIVPLLRNKGIGPWFLYLIIRSRNLRS